MRGGMLPWEGIRVFFSDLLIPERAGTQGIFDLLGQL